jgi:hypothetical protein
MPKAMLNTSSSANSQNTVILSVREEPRPKSAPVIERREGLHKSELTGEKILVLLGEYGCKRDGIHNRVVAIDT